MFLVCSTSARQRQVNPDTVDYYRLVTTTDVLVWNGSVYLMDRSPLCAFAGYRDLFPDLPGVGSRTDLKEPGYRTLVEDKNYGVLWSLVDSVLYVKDLFFQTLVLNQSLRNYFPDGRQYGMLEKLTGYSFRKADFPETSSAGPSGVMPAVWVTGTFYVKRARSGIDEDFQQWDRKNFLQLTFRSGKLRSVRIFKNHPLLRSRSVPGTKDSPTDPSGSASGKSEYLLYKDIK